MRKSLQKRKCNPKDNSGTLFHHCHCHRRYHSHPPLHRLRWRSSCLSFSDTPLPESLNQISHSTVSQSRLVQTFLPFLSQHQRPTPLSLNQISHSNAHPMRSRTRRRLVERISSTTSRNGDLAKMLRIPDHQVAGHKAKDGILGPLIDGSGNFYKPLQNDERGSNEVTFYKSLYSDPRVPQNIRGYFPIFHGTKLVNASDGSGLHPHLVLEDVVSRYMNPSVMDVKIGSRTWYPQASEEYIQKCLKKDRETSSITLGFRISGLKLVGSSKEDSLSWQPGRKFLQNLSAEDVMLVLSKFVSSNMPSNDAAACPNRSFAAKVFGGSNGVLEQLLEIKKWFEVQTIFHFYSCSVLMVYEKESVLKGKSSGAVVKLVDFAHVVDAKGAIDHNFLGGLCSLIKFISDILASPDENCISNHNCTKDEH